MKKKTIKVMAAMLALIIYTLFVYMLFNFYRFYGAIWFIIPTMAFIPKNLNLEIFLKQHPPKFKYNIDKFRYIVSLITAIPAFNKEILDNYDFVPINAKTLQKKVSDYPKYFDYLISHGIFETDRHFVPGIKSKGFRFTPKYRVPIKVERIKPTVKNKSITKQKEKFKMQKKYNYLFRWMNPMLQISFNDAVDYLKTELVYNSKADLGKALRKFNATYANIFRINEADFYFSVDSNIHRLHTNLTNLKKEYRNFITYNGQSLVAVDFINSQPLISCVLLHEDFYKFTIEGAEREFNFNWYNISNQISQYFNTNPNISYSLPSTLSPSIMVPKNEENHTRKGFQKYLTECENGVIYEYIQKELKEQCQIEVADRKTLKSIVFTTLFTDNKFIGQPEAEPKRLFKYLFPDVYRVFSLLKKGDKRFLPILLQSIESKLMLDYVTRRISDERPDMPIWTIHDSVVCPVGNEKYVANVMKEEAQKAIGVTPKVNFEYWTPDNLNGNTTANNIQFFKPDIA